MRNNWAAPCRKWHAAQPVAAAGTTLWWPHHPVLRPMVLKSSSRGQFLPTPERGQHHGTILLVRRDGEGRLAAAATPQFGPRHPVLRPVVLESSSRCHFLPTPNRGRRGGPNLSVRRDGRERVGACGRSCHGLPRAPDALRVRSAAGHYRQATSIGPIHAAGFLHPLPLLTAVKGTRAACGKIEAGVGKIRRPTVLARDTT